MQRLDLSFDDPHWVPHVAEIHGGVVARGAPYKRILLEGDGAGIPDLTTQWAPRDGTDYVVRFQSGKRTRVVVETDGCNRPHAAYTLEVDRKHAWRSHVEVAALLIQLALEEVARSYPPRHPTPSPHAPRGHRRRQRHAGLLAHASWCRTHGDKRGARDALERARFVRCGGAR